MIKKIIFFLILSLLTSFFTEKFISVQSNTLASHYSWYSIKQISSAALGLMGVLDFPFERTSLAQEKLNLGVWFGYQDVIYKEPLPDFETYRVNFELTSDKSYLWTYLNCDEERCYALRTSAYADYPSGIFEIDLDGKFIKKISDGPLLSKGGHQIEVIKNNFSYTISVDQKNIYEMKYDKPFKPIRFLGSLNPTIIQKIEYTDADQKNYTIDFKARFHIFRFFVILAAFSILSGLIFLFTKNWNYIFLGNFVLLIFSVIIFSFDYFYWSHLYITDNHSPQSAPYPKLITSIEKIRKDLFLNPVEIDRQNNFLHMPVWYTPFQPLQNQQKHISINDIQLIDENAQVTYKEKIDDDLRHFSDNKFKKIAVIGSSQAWGAGASKLNKSWAALLVKNLSEKSKQPVVGINFSICGTKLYNFNAMTDYILKFKPDLLIASFGANDSDTPPAYFENQLNEFFGKMKDAKINVLLNIEALSYEKSKEETNKAELIRSYAEKNHIPVVSLHQYLSSQEERDSGMIWHDHVHFTNYGHILTSNFFINTDSFKKLTSK